MVKKHNSLNYAKGSIGSKRYIDTDYDTLIAKMEDHVVDLYKVQRKELGEFVKTGTMILTFDTCNLPSHFKIGWKRFEVREYIPAPRRCFKCQVYNYSSKSCYAQQTVCVNCGESQHGTECHSPPHCVNCDEHPASDKTCFYYRFEKEILTINIREKVRYSEAKKTALKTLSAQLSHTHKLQSQIILIKLSPIIKSPSK